MDYHTQETSLPSFTKEILIWNIWFQQTKHKQQTIFNNNS